MPPPATATPTTVPLKGLGPEEPCPAKPALGGGVAADGRGAAGGASGGIGPWFIIIVPLNFGAAAPFNWKLHFEHAWAPSGFWVPQLGQNTEYLARTGRPAGKKVRAAYAIRREILKEIVG